MMPLLPDRMLPLWGLLASIGAMGLHMRILSSGEYGWFGWINSGIAVIWWPYVAYNFYSRLP
jgi:hypothetical protein